MNLRRTMLGALMLLTAALPVAAQDWPARNLRILVPFPAGGSFDTQARVVADELTKALGQSVIVENKPGAGGMIGAAEAARAPADGYTIFMGSNGTQAANVFLYNKINYDPEKDFTPLTLMTIYPLLIVPGEKYKTEKLDGLIAAIKRATEPVNYGSSGSGSPTHLAGELFKREIGGNLVHVPYRGQGPALTDLLGGRLDLMFPSVPDVLTHLQAGKLSAIAIMADSRSKVLPDIPTTAELGQPKLVSSIWAGLYVPTGTPQPIVDRLHRELVQILSAPRFRGVVEPLGFEVKTMPQDEFRAFNNKDREQQGAFIKALGLKLD
jgi:tripartite-type tricarboxylate transporter receptor subunit TctC